MHRWQFASLTCSLLASGSIFLSMYFSHRANALREALRTDMDDIESPWEDLSNKVEALTDKVDSLKEDGGDRQNIKTEAEALEHEYDGVLKRVRGIIDRNKLADEYEEVSHGLSVAAAVLIVLQLIFLVRWRRESRKLQPAALVDPRKKDKEPVDRDLSVN